MVTYAALVLLTAQSLATGLVRAEEPRVASTFVSSCDGVVQRADASHSDGFVGAVEEARDGDGGDPIVAAMAGASDLELRCSITSLRPRRTEARRLYGDGVSCHSARGPPFA